MWPVLVLLLIGASFILFLLRPLTVQMKQTRQSVCAVKQSILLRCPWDRPIKDYFEATDTQLLSGIYPMAKIALSWGFFNIENILCASKCAIFTKKPYDHLTNVRTKREPYLKNENKKIKITLFIMPLTQRLIFRIFENRYLE
jgi:hypothetical protein